MNLTIQVKGVMNIISNAFKLTPTYVGIEKIFENYQYLAVLAYAHP